MPNYQKKINYQKNHLGAQHKVLMGMKFSRQKKPLQIWEDFFFNVNRYKNNLPELIIIGQDQNVRDTSEYKKID